MEDKSLKEQIEDYLKTLGFKIDKNTYTREFLFQQQSTTYINGNPVKVPPQKYNCKIEYMGIGLIDDIETYFYLFQLGENEWEFAVNFEQNINSIEEFKNILKTNIGI